MSSVLADTHAILWTLFAIDRLSSNALGALRVAEAKGRIYASSITLVELSYLEGKPKFPYPGSLTRLIAMATDPAAPIEILPVTLDVAVALDKLPRDELPDMPDRIIAATATVHQLPLVSADARMLASPSLRAKVQVIW